MSRNDVEGPYDLMFLQKHEFQFSQYKLNLLKVISTNKM